MIQRDYHPDRIPEPAELAALAQRRVLGEPYLGACRKLVGRIAVYNPDVISRIDRDSDRGTLEPVVRQRLGPEGIDLEHGCFPSGRCGGGVGCGLAAAHGDRQGEQSSKNEEATRRFHGIPLC